MPLTGTVRKGVFDRIHVKKEFKEIAANHNPVNNLKGYAVILLLLIFVVSCLSTEG